MRNPIWSITPLLLVLTLWFMFGDVKAQPLPPGYFLESKVKLLEKRVSQLEEEVKALRSYLRGNIQVYRVDSVAGTMVCRSCRYQSEGEWKP